MRSARTANGRASASVRTGERGLEEVNRSPFFLLPEVVELLHSHNVLHWANDCVNKNKGGDTTTRTGVETAGSGKDLGFWLWPLSFSLCSDAIGIPRDWVAELGVWGTSIACQRRRKAILVVSSGEGNLPRQDCHLAGRRLRGPGAHDGRRRILTSIL